MVKKIAPLGLSVVIAIAPLAALLTSCLPAAAATYKFDYVPKRSDSYTERMRQMDNLSKERARASADWMRRHRRRLFW